MSIRRSTRATIAATYIGHITQAIVNNFAPLLFVTFSTAWDIPLTRVLILVSVNFGVQLVVDLLCAAFMDKLDYRIPIVLSQVFAAAGLVGLGVFPYLFSDPFVGLALAVAVYAVGGGLTEVLISPIVQACPTENKEAHMNLLHSFYCWGHVAVILGSTLFFAVAGIENWRYLAFLWAIVPAVAGVMFALVPLRRLDDNIPPAERISFFGLFKKPLFWLFVLMMACAGASEQAMGQWASAFAEAGLGVSKTIGDLTGPCMFALCMGLSRIVTARLSRRFSVEAIMTASAILCVVAYLLSALAPMPTLSLVGCALCGFSVGIFWPGTFSFGADRLRGGRTALFALLALGGDIGSVSGPALVNYAAKWLADGSVRLGMLFAVIFPIILAGCVLILRYTQKHTHKKNMEKRKIFDHE